MKPDTIKFLSSMIVFACLVLFGIRVWMGVKSDYPIEAGVLYVTWILGSSMGCFGQFFIKDSKCVRLIGHCPDFTSPQGCCHCHKKSLNT